MMNLKDTNNAAADDVRITVAPDRIASRRSYSSAAVHRAKSASDYKGLAILVVVAFFVIGISYQVINDNPLPTMRKTPVNKPRFNIDENINQVAAQLPIQQQQQQQQQPIEQQQQAAAVVEKQNPVQKVPEQNAQKQPASGQPRSQPGSASKSKQKRDMSWYRPFDGGFWDEYPAAKKVLSEYVTKASQTRKNPSNAPLKGYVQYTPMAEMCNQLLGLVASFGFALVTDRYFALTTSAPAWYRNVFNPEIDGFNWMFENFPSAQIGSSRLITNREFSTDTSQKAFPTETMLCNDLKSEYGGDSTINMNVNQYFIPLLQQNGHHQAVFDEIGEDVFRPLGRLLLQPHPDLASKVDSFRRDHFDGKFVVGIHLRAGGGWPATSEQWHVYWDAAKEAETHNTEDLPVVWFLAADMNAPRENAKSLFADKIIMFESVFGTSDLSTLYRVAFADVLLLAECDQIVTSSWSTYSYVAAGLAGLKPYIVTEDKKPQQVSKDRGAAMIKWAGLDFWSNKRTVFHKQPTSQPCFHFYFDWRVQDAHCFNGEGHIQHEYFDGNRYC